MDGGFSSVAAFSLVIAVRCSSLNWLHRQSLSQSLVVLSGDEPLAQLLQNVLCVCVNSLESLAGAGVVEDARC